MCACGVLVQNCTLSVLLYFQYCSIFISNSVPSIDLYVLHTQGHGHLETGRTHWVVPTDIIHGQLKGVPHRKYTGIGVHNSEARGQQGVF